MGGRRGAASQTVDQSFVLDSIEDTIYQTGRFHARFQHDDDDVMIIAFVFHPSVSLSATSPYLQRFALTVPQPMLAPEGHLRSLPLDRPLHHP